MYNILQNNLQIFKYIHTYIHTYIFTYIHGWKQAVSHRKMRITFGVIANHFGKVISNIANYLEVICESLFAKRPF